MNMAVMSQTIAEKTELKPKNVRAVFNALSEIAQAEVSRTQKFTIPHIVTLKLKPKPATKAGKKMMFGNLVKVAAKPAKKVVKAFAAKALKDSVWGPSAWVWEHSGKIAPHVNS